MLKDLLKHFQNLFDSHVATPALKNRSAIWDQINKEQGENKKFVKDAKDVIALKK